MQCSFFSQLSNLSFSFTAPKRKTKPPRKTKKRIRPMIIHKTLYSPALPLMYRLARVPTPPAAPLVRPARGILCRAVHIQIWPQTLKSSFDLQVIFYDSFATKTLNIRLKKLPKQTVISLESSSL